MDEFIAHFTAPKVIGIIACIATSVYILLFTARHRKDFIEGMKGEDGKLQFIEGVLSIWLILFTSMIICDFTLGLHASVEAWWSMDSIFAFGVAGGVFKQRQRVAELKNQNDA